MQKLFIDYYIELNGNGTQAAIKAGYAPGSAKQKASENLDKPHIREALDKRLKVLEAARIANMKETRQFWSTAMRDENAKLSDRLKASEYIARSNGAFLERVQHELPPDLTVNIIPASQTK